MNLDRYFERIGYIGRPSATLDTLAALHRLHPQAIPFENLNPLLGWPVRLEADALVQKMVEGRRGGYCYEHNLLFAEVLKTIGFSVTGLAARAIWNVPDGVVRPRSHMLLRVEVDGTSYLADVGFGGLTQTGPVRFEIGIEQPTPHEPFRVERNGDELVMQVFVQDAWRSLYRFTLEEHLLPDYEMGNWYVSTCPASMFVTSLIAARAEPGRRHALRNNELAVYTMGAPPQRRLLSGVGEIRDVLETSFGLTLPDTPELDTRLAQVLERAGLQ